MFTGHMTLLLPLREAISGPRQTIPILWTSGGATLNRIGDINWRAIEFFVENINDLTEPFSGLRPKGFIPDFEYLAELGSVLLRGGIYSKEIVINVTDNRSALSWMDGARVSVGPSSLLQLTSHRELIRRHIHVHGMYLLPEQRG